MKRLKSYLLDCFYAMVLMAWVGLPSRMLLDCFTTMHDDPFPLIVFWLRKRYGQKEEPCTTTQSTGA